MLDTLGLISLRLPTMTKAEFYLLIDELLESTPGTVRGADRLADVAKWDSLAVIGFIALLDQHFGVSVPASKIADCRTIDDLAGLLEDKLSQ